MAIPYKSIALILILAGLTSACNLTGACGFDAVPCGSPGGTSGAGGSTSVIPCGVDVCSDGEGGQLQDIGQACAGDDVNPAPPGGPTCCYGLSCVGASASLMGQCVRLDMSMSGQCPSSTDGGTGSMWLYQCTGVYSLGDGPSALRVGTFTGPPPSQVTAQGGLGAWMKIKFAAAHPTIQIGGDTWALLSAKACQPLGPLPSM